MGPNAADSESEEPQPHGRVDWIVRPDQWSALSNDPETRASNGGRSAWAVVKVNALHKEVRELSLCPQAADLTPETSSLQAQMEVRNRLALDEHATPEVIVAGRKLSYLDVDTGPAQHIGNPARKLEGVGDNSRAARRRQSHGRSA